MRGRLRRAIDDRGTYERSTWCKSTNLRTKPSNAQAKDANDESNRQPCTLTFLVTDLLI